LSPADRTLASDALRFRLQEEQGRLNDTALLERSGRNARTLVKQGPLWVTLVRVGAGGRITPHRAAGPITVQVLDGDIGSTRQAGTTGFPPATCWCWTPVWNTMSIRKVAILLDLGPFLADGRWPALTAPTREPRSKLG